MPMKPALLDSVDFLKFEGYDYEKSPRFPSGSCRVQV